MIASVMSAATFTPMSNIDQSKPGSPSPGQDLLQPCAGQMTRSGTGCAQPSREFAFAARQGGRRVGPASRRRASPSNAFSRSVFSRSILARIDLDHALGRFGLELRRRVAGEHDRGHAALAGLSKHVGRKRIGNSEHAFGDGVRRRRRHNQRMIDAVVEESDRRRARRRIAEDARRFWQLQIPA